MQRAANAWDRFYRYHEAPWRGERPLAPLEPWLNGRTLELGVGNGKLLKPLQAEGMDVVGLDVSWNVLHRLGHGVLADAHKLPFAADSFDTVLDIHCTGHLLSPQRAEAMQDAARVLRSGGHLLMERLHPEDLRAQKGEVLEPNTRQLADGRSTHFSDEAELAAEMEVAGLQVVHRETVRRTPKLRGEQVVRSSVLVVARKP